MEIEIKNWLTDEVIFAHECENNTIKTTVEAAVSAGVSLNGAELNYAELNHAKLNGAKLNGANLDFSVLPLWCDSFDIKCDIRLAAQLAYHFCRLNCDGKLYKAARLAMLPLARRFHRYSECGKLE